MTVPVERSPSLPPAPPGRSLFATARNVLLFALGWMGVGTLIHRVLPAPPIADPVQAVKLEHFASHRDEYDTIFFGSSLIYRDVIPEVFDAEMARAGDPTHSFNFGVGGMQQHETDSLIQEVLALRPKKLRYAFIELGRWRTDIHPQNRFKERVVAWHTWRETTSVVGSIWLRERWPTSVSRTVDHLQHMAFRYARIGEGPQLLSEAVGIAPFKRGQRDPDLPLIGPQHGYAGLYADRDYTAQPQHKNHHDILIQTRDNLYADSVKRLIHNNRHAGDIEAQFAAFNLPAMERQIRQLKSLGIEPIFVVMPQETSMPELRLLVERGHLRALFAYNDPETYPQFYAFERRFDWNHLEHSGAVMFTTLLADDFLAAQRNTSPASSVAP